MLGFCESDRSIRLSLIQSAMTLRDNWPDFNVPLWEWEEIPRLQAETSVRPLEDGVRV